MALSSSFTVYWPDGQHLVAQILPAALFPLARRKYKLRRLGVGSVATWQSSLGDVFSTAVHEEDAYYPCKEMKVAARHGKRSTLSIKELASSRLAKKARSVDFLSQMISATLSSALISELCREERLLGDLCDITLRSAVPVRHFRPLGLHSAPTGIVHSLLLQDLEQDATSGVPIPERVPVYSIREGKFFFFDFHIPEVVYFLNGPVIFFSPKESANVYCSAEFLFHLVSLLIRPQVMPFSHLLSKSSLEARKTPFSRSPSIQSELCRRLDRISFEPAK